MAWKGWGFMDEQTKVIKRLKITLACVVVFLGGIAGFFGYLLNEEVNNTSELRYQLSETEEAKDKWYEKYQMVEKHSEEVYSLRSENKTLNTTVSEQEKTINEQAERISELETQLASCSKPTSSSGPSSSSGSTGSTSSTSDTQTVTVYITRTGEKYHRNGCQYLSQSKIPVSLSDAKAQGYTACSVCF